MTPLDVALSTLPGAFVSGLLLLATWKWRARSWPVPLALGLGYATSHALAFGLPELNPADSVEFMFHFALAGAALGIVEATLRPPARVLWPVRGLFAAAVAWLMLRNLVEYTWEGTGERVFWLLVAGGSLLANWGALDWRAKKLEGFGLPLVLVIVVSGGSAALVAGESAKLGQMAGMLAAAVGPLVLYGWLRRDLKLDDGGITVYVLVATALWIAGYFFDALEGPSALLLLAAPLAARPRRWWLGAAIATVLVAGAAGITHLAKTAGDDSGEPDPYEEYYK